MIIVVLDDINSMIQHFKDNIPKAKCYKTAKACIKAIEKEEMLNVLFLNDTAEPVIDWIIKEEPQIRNIIIHTPDAATGKDFEARLKMAMYNVRYVPWNILKDRLEGFEL